MKRIPEVRIHHFAAGLMAVIAVCRAACPAFGQEDDAAPAGADAGEKNPVLIEDERITDADVLRFKKSSPEFNKNWNAAQLRPVIDEGIRVMIGELSLKSNRGRLLEVRNAIERKLRSAGSFTKRPLQKREFREHVLKKVVEHAEPLLQGNFQVRLNAIILLSSLELVPPNPIKNVEAEFYDPVHAVFQRVLRDPKQNEAVRIWAVRGLRRAFADGALPAPTRSGICEELLFAELAKPDASSWMKHRVVEALGHVDLARSGGKVAFVLDPLTKVVNDKGYDAIVRSEAAKQAARVKEEPQINYELLAWLGVKLGKEMAVQQQQAPKQAKWRICFLNLYLMYLPKDKTEANRRDAGLLTRTQGTPDEKSVRAAFTQVRPLVNHVLTSSKPFDDKVIKGLDTWLESNEPTNFVLVPGLAPINVKRVAAGTPAKTESADASPAG